MLGGGYLGVSGPRKRKIAKIAIFFLSDLGEICRVYAGNRSTTGVCNIWWIRLVSQKFIGKSRDGGISPEIFGVPISETTGLIEQIKRGAKIVRAFLISCKV